MGSLELFVVRHARRPRPDEPRDRRCGPRAAAGPRSLAQRLLRDELLRACAVLSSMKSRRLDWPGSPATCDKIFWNSLMKIIQLVIFAAAALHGADSVLPKGAKPRNLGSVNAGEGPAWDGKSNLYFTDEHRITVRDSAGEIHVFREPSNDANGLLFDSQGRLTICESASRRIT